MIADIIFFNGEYDLLEIRLNILDKYVDRFVIMEFDKTFSGKEKPYYYLEQKERYKKWKDKIYYYKMADEFIRQEYWDLAEKSPNTIGAEHWKREFAQKEMIRECFKHWKLNPYDDKELELKDDDILFIGDCDEIWNENKKNLYHTEHISPIKLKLKVYTYWLNNRSNEEFWGTLRASYKDIKNECLNHLRTNAKKTPFDCGWHFTSMAGDLERKLTDSYTEETYANKQVMDNLEQNIKESKDFLGRDFKYWIDESEWPQYLKGNKDKYKHLLKPI
jgi:beta-1,4-mannosyl-glycoprotein beta-1,4-N-acetylglucosaminyltransferase